MNHFNTPDIFTQRLILRKFTKADTNDLFELLRDKETNKFLPWFPLETVEQAKDFIDTKFLCYYEKPVSYRYAICLKEDNKVIGYINLQDDDSHDFGYGLRREYWGKGIVTEASIALINQIKSDGQIPYITATHDVNNIGSGKVMQKAGLQYKYSFVEVVQPKNVQVTFKMYQLNFDKNDTSTYVKYWEMYDNHFVE